MSFQAKKAFLERIGQMALYTIPDGAYPWDLSVHSKKSGGPTIIYQEPAQIIDRDNRLLKIAPSPLGLFMNCYNLSQASGSNTMDILDLEKIIGPNLLAHCKNAGWLEHHNDIELDSSDLGWRVGSIVKGSESAFPETKGLIENRNKYDFFSSRQYDAFLLKSLAKEHCLSACRSNGLDNRQANLAVYLSLQMFGQQYGLCLDKEDNSFLVSTWRKDFGSKPTLTAESFAKACEVGLSSCESMVRMFSDSINKEYRLSDLAAPANQHEPSEDLEAPIQEWTQ